MPRLCPTPSPQVIALRSRNTGAELIKERMHGLLRVCRGKRGQFQSSRSLRAPLSYWSQIFVHWFPLVVEHAVYETKLALTANDCQFKQCTFAKFQGSGTLISMSNQGMSCLFHSCLFTVISVWLLADIIFFPSAVESTLMYCCFNDDVCYAFYGSGSGNCWCVASSSINSTVCMNSNTNQAPWTGGIDKFTFFFDNHTYLPHWA